MPRFKVTSYVVQGSPLLSTNVLVPLLSQYSGANVSLKELVQAASDLQAAYRTNGYPMVSVAFAPEQITNGVVTLNVFQTAIPQIVVSGRRLVTINAPETSTNLPPTAPASTRQPALAAAVTNAPPAAVPGRMAPATPAEIVETRAALLRKIAELNEEAKDTRVHVVSTNAGPRFAVERYLVTGNSILSPETIAHVLTNIDGAFGTNVSFDGVRTVVEQLQQAYSERGYVTVVVGLPQQLLTNETVKVQVTEGRLAGIKFDWIGHRYFSSNNVMRALPSLRTNIIINAPIFNSELNRANANQDRQIYPLIGPGPVPGTSELTLQVKDRLPLHAKTELDNHNSPGTPGLRLNSSAVYDNLWQLEHSFGVQYGFSPELYKPGGPWDFYDEPVVAYYSAFYRLPLGSPEAIQNVVANNPDSFGYNEATRKFILPPSSGRPDLTFFASRSTIDTGTTTTFSESVTAPGKNPSISRQDVVHSPIRNQDVGIHFNYPMPAFVDFQSGFSGGLDFKTYDITSYATNIFFITQTNFDANGNPILPPIPSAVPSLVPITASHIEYLPLSLRYDGSWHDSRGTTTFGLGVSFNVWHDSLYSTTTFETNVAHTTSLNGSRAIKSITGSAESSGYWVVFNPRISRDIVIKGWTTSILADGQWASEPLISPEQFGVGGVNSVRGYHEGEVFGDEGLRLSLEQQTPTYTVGLVRGGAPLTVRGSIYMGYARVYLIDPQGRPSGTSLWGAGFGFSASVGSHWQSQFLFSWPLLSAGTTPAYQPFFDFALGAQF